MLVGGSGEYSVLDNNIVIKRFIDYLGEIVESIVPMFASCFGFQALALAYGGTVIHDEEKAEVGTYEIYTTMNAENDPIFQQLPKRFLAQLGHQDHVTVLPSEFIHLAGSERSEHQAFKHISKSLCNSVPSRAHIFG